MQGTLFKYNHKYENASVSKNLFESGDYVFTFDLKSSYHHIMMHELDKEYLGFEWRVSMMFSRYCHLDLVQLDTYFLR